MKRCIVNVSHGARYQPMGARLVQSLQYVGDDVPILQWINTLPPGAPDVPMPFGGYCSKPFAMLEAVRQGYEVILWLDAACYAISHPYSLFGHIQHAGHYVQDNGFNAGQWCSDAALPRLGIGRGESFTIPELSSMAVGLDVRKEDSRTFLNEWAALASDGVTFMAEHANDHGNVLATESPRRTVGHVSDDPRVLGHRHDQTAASVLAWRRGWQRTPRGEFVNYWQETPDPRTVIVNRG